MKKLTPFTPLLLLLGVGALSALLMAVIPARGIGSGAFRIRFKTLSSVLHPGMEVQPLDVGAYLARLDSLQSIRDSLRDASGNIIVKRRQGITSIQFRNGDSSPFFPFFEALDAAAGGQSFHVLHYGDSQIEMDRMTGFLREQWQSDFGGSGPGLIPPVPLTPPGSMGHRASSNWKRYTAYGFDTGKVEHNRYGVLCSFGRFSDYRLASSIQPSDTLIGWIELSPSNTAKQRARQYSSGTVYFGYHQYPVEIRILADDSLISREIHDPSGQIIRHTFRTASTRLLRIEFRGPDSPDVHAILLEGEPGVRVDNIALRGSNGNIFRRLDPRDISTEYADLKPRLIIMQFGGNSVPYVTTRQQAEQYASFFGSQIKMLRRLAPEAAFLVIGPSDMSTRVDGNYVTWPGLEFVRDAMRETAFEEGCGFWDMYEVMGGNQSMVSWVASDPPYAGPDHTHFTPLGARKMAELLHRAIDIEYEAWKAGRTAAFKEPAAALK